MLGSKKRGKPPPGQVPTRTAHEGSAKPPTLPPPHQGFQPLKNLCLQFHAGRRNNPASHGHWQVPASCGQGGQIAQFVRHGSMRIGQEEKTTRRDLPRETVWWKALGLKPSAHIAIWYHLHGRRAYRGQPLRAQRHIIIISAGHTRKKSAKC